jgi:molybdopterin converting factor small subunit
MQVRVRFLGSMRAITGFKELEVKLPEGSEVSDLLHVLSVDHPELWTILADPLPGNLIFVGGVEVSNLDGIKTRLVDDSEVIMVPVTHGG